MPDGSRKPPAVRTAHPTPKSASRGLLVPFSAQRPAAISLLTLDHVHADEQQTRLRRGREPVVLPETLAAHIRQLVASHRGHATLGDPGTARGCPRRTSSRKETGQ